MVDCHILAETPSKLSKEPAFIPAKDIQNLTILKVLEKLNQKGHPFTFTEGNTKPIKDISKLLDLARNDFEKGLYNKAIKDI